MKFVGKVWEEGGELRGKLEILADDATGQVYHFKDFDEMKVVLEKHFPNQIKK